MKTNQRELKFIDGTSWIVGEDDCRGCLMQTRKSSLTKHLEPIYSDDEVLVIQDAEFSVPAFYIVSTVRHISSISDMTDVELIKVFKVTREIRRGLQKIFHIEIANIYHEERLKNSHYHHWILPIWNKIADKNKIYPKIYSSNVKKYSKFKPSITGYLDLFSFDEYSDQILKCNSLMKEYLLENFNE